MWYTLKPVLLIAVFLGFSLFLNDFIVEYRFQELDRAMAQLSKNSNVNHSLNMLARLHMIQKRQEQEDSDQSAFEVKLQALTSGALVEETPGYTVPKLALAMVVKGVGRVLGKPPTITQQSPITRKELEIAYFFERTRKYDRAVQIYDKTLNMLSEGDPLRNTIKLHLGFCQSMLGRYEPAIVQFQDVRVSPRSVDEGIVAEKLLDHVSDLNRKVAHARSANISDMAKAKSFFTLANYQEAIKLLQGELEGGRLVKGQKAEILYYLGRSQEELGLEGFAVEQYEKLMAEFPESGFAKRANRRMYIMGKFYSYNDKLTNAAMERIEQYRDDQFFNQMQDFEKLQRNDRKLIEEAEKRPVLADDAQLKALRDLDAIDVGDLDGSREAAETVAREASTPQNPVERTPQKALVRPGQIVRTDIDPVRRDAIFQSIENNSGELQFIYQKYLRKGEAFEGRLTLRLTVDATGRVLSSQVDGTRSNISHSTFLSDIEKRAGGWKFRPDPKKGSPVTISFPIRFVKR